MTGLRTLAEPLDTSAAQYAKGGHLLCHDDDLSGRVIAFIVYLVDEDWTAEVSRGDVFVSPAICAGPVAPWDMMRPILSRTQAPRGLQWRFTSKFSDPHQARPSAAAHSSPSVCKPARLYSCGMCTPGT